MKSVAIIHGFAEGKWHSQKLEAALATAGFTVEPNPSQADIIITHSAGCFLVPAKAAAKLIILVGVPYRPGTPVIKSTVSKVGHDAKLSITQKRFGHWLLKTFWNSCYIFGHLIRWGRMQQARRALNLPTGRSNQKVITVRNQLDKFSTQQTIDQLARQHGWQVVNQAGGHDDIWFNPKPYVALIKGNL